MMRILIISYYIPYPLNTGGRISQYAFLDYLRHIHKITLAVFAYTTLDMQHIEALQNIFPDINFIALTPYPLKESQIIFSEINEQQYPIDKKQELLVNPLKIHEHEDPYFTFIGEPKERQLIESLSPLFEGENYDIIQVEFLEIMDFIYALPRNAKTVFVHHEIRFSRLKSYLGASKQHIGPFEQYILNHVKASEGNLLNRYSAIFTLSEEDKKILEDYDLQVPVYVSPFPILENHFIELNTELSFNKLVFIGEDSHFPNVDAVQWYDKEIRSEIKVRFNLDLHVIGVWKAKSIRQFSSEGIIFTGYIDDLIDYCANSVLIVPVRIGSGLRTKILYAMAQGVPVITTSFGCEGIPVVDGKHVIIANSSREMVNAIIYLKEHPEQLKSLAVNAQQLMRNVFSQKVAGELRNSLIERITQP